MCSTFSVFVCLSVILILSTRESERGEKGKHNFRFGRGKVFGSIIASHQSKSKSKSRKKQKKIWRFSLFIELINFCQIFRWMEAKDYPGKNETLPD